MKKRLIELAELYRTTIQAEQETLYIKGEVLCEAKTICKDNGKLWSMWLDEAEEEKSRAAVLIKAHKTNLSKLAPVQHLTKLKLLLPLIGNDGDTTKVEEFVKSVGGTEGVNRTGKRELRDKIQEFTGKRVPEEEMARRNDEAWEDYKANTPEPELSTKAQASIRSTLKKVSLKWNGVDLSQDGEDLLEAITHIEHWINYLYSKMEDEKLQPEIQTFLNQLADKISQPLTLLK